MSIVIDDFILLGRAVPVRLKDGRATICAAGISEKMGGLIRVYPTKVEMPIKVWDICQVKVERNESDTRSESWKISGSKVEWNHLSDKIAKIGEIKEGIKKATIIHKFQTPCSVILNEQKCSLGLIKPNISKCKIVPYQNEKKMDSSRTSIDEFLDPENGDNFYQRWLNTINNFKVEPRILWNCSFDCKLDSLHDMKVLEWGVYEWFRKFPNKKEQVWENLKLGDNEYEKYFLIGNQAQHRNAFLIISIIRWKKSKEEGLKTLF